MPEESEQSPRALLRKVKSAVRTGRYPGSETEDWGENLRLDFGVLHRTSKDFDFTERLELITLEAEFLDLDQYSEEASRILRRFVAPPTLEGEAADLKSWFRDLPARTAEPGEKRKREVRQMVWALLLYVWLNYYRAHRYEQALPLLRRIREIIDEENVGSKRGGYGTLSRWYFVRAECFRGKRSFAEAQQDFLQSQEYAHLRLDREIRDLRKSPNAEKLENAIRFGTICTARILTFLGWAAVQQGRLTRGRQLLAAAETLVAATGAHYTRLFVRTRSLIAQRRHTNPVYEELAPVLEKLRQTAIDYHAKDHASGQLRCRTEIVRGFLDLAEFAKNPEDKATWLAEAAKGIAAIRDLNQDGDRVWLSRSRFLSIKHLILAKDLKEARKEWQLFSDETEPGDHRRFHVDLFEALLLLREEKVENAINILERLLPQVATDPMIDAECRLLLAECYAAGRRSRPTVEAQLREWRKLKLIVENTYHRSIEQRLEGLLTWTHDFVIDFNAGGLDWNDQQAALRKWLLAAARARLGQDATLEKLSALIGTSTSTLSRWG